MFQILHWMFEAAHNDIALVVDLIAEGIRAVGLLDLGTLLNSKRSRRKLSPPPVVRKKSQASQLRQEWILSSLTLLRLNRLSNVSITSPNAMAVSTVWSIASDPFFSSLLI